MPDLHLPTTEPPIGEPGVPLVALLHPFRMERIERVAPSGLTIAEMMVWSGIDPGSLGANARVWIDDAWAIPRDRWHRVRPRPGRRLTLRVVPGNGGGGGGGKNPLRIILSIAVIAASFILGPIAGAALGPALGIGVQTATWIAQAAIGIVGGLIVNAIAPPGLPDLPALAANANEQSAPVYSIVGSTNRANPWGAVPVVLGKHRIWPPYGAKYYTELRGDDQYLHCLFCLGPGPLVLSEHKIGETPIADYEDIEIEVRQGYSGEDPPGLFPGPVHEEAVAADLTAAGGWVQRTSKAGATALSVDVACPRGLTEWTEQGGRVGRDVTIEVDYAVAGSGAWAAAGTLTLADNNTSAVRRHLDWTVAAGQYDVRLRRTTADATSDQVVDVTQWSVLRSVLPGRAVLADGICQVALRIRATGQLNGTVQEYNCVASRVAPHWDGAAWVTAETACPSAMVRWVLQGGAIARPPIADAKIDLATLEDWAEACTAAGRECNGIIDSQRRLGDVLHDIAATGRARRGGTGGKYTIVMDRPQTVPIQLIGPRNSWGFKAKKEFRDLPHGLHCRFVNRLSGYQSDQVEVFDDGYDALTATRYETMEFPWVVDPDQVHRDARYQLAQYRLRPESYECSLDIEHLVATRGDLIEVSHDVLLVGLGQARIKGVTTGESDVITGLVLDEPMVLVAGTRYGLRGRDALGTPFLGEVTGTVGETASLTLVAPLAAGACAAGDLVALGELGIETLACIVREIEGGPDLSAKLTLVPAAPGVHLADQGPIPAWDPRITRAPAPARPAPDQPIVASVRSDEDVLIAAADGSLATRIVIALERRSGGTEAVLIEVQHRRSGGSDWTHDPSMPGGATEISIGGVEDGVAYDVRVRAVSTGWVASAWTYVAGHVVVGQTTLPPDVPQAWVHGSALWWTYPAPPRDFPGGFRIFSLPGVNRNRGAAVPAHPGVVAAPPFDLGALGGGTRTIFLVAVDRGGRESANAAILVRGLGDPELANVVVEQDYAPDWLGTVTGGTVTGGEVRADGDGELYLPAGDAPYLPDGDAAYLPVQYGAMAWRAALTPPADAVPCRLTLKWSVSGEAWSVWVRGAGDDLYLPGDADPYLPDDSAYLGGWDSWVPWGGAMDLAERVPLEIEVRTVAGTRQGKITGMIAVLDVPDRVVEIEGLVVPVGGIRVPLDPPFRAIASIRTTASYAPGAATQILPADRDPSGPLLIGLLGDDTPAAGVAGVTIKGY